MKRYGLAHTIMMDWLHARWQKNYSHMHRRKAGGVCGQVLSAEGHFITPAVLPECRRSHRGNGWKWLIYTAVCAILISEKFPNSYSFFWRLRV